MNQDFIAEPGEYSSAQQLARQIGAEAGLLKGQYDPEAKLNLAFYNKAVINERKSKLGYHNVFGLDNQQLFEDEAKTVPVVADCDCEEENIIRGSKQASTLQRVIRERTLRGLHVTPGRPIYEDKIYVRIFVPGEQRNEVDTEAIIVNDPDYPDTHQVSDLKAAHNLKYPRHWEDYKKRQNKRLEGAATFGTPLKMLAQEGVFVLKPAQVAAFEGAGIRTVEQLLAMPDNVSQHFMGFSTIRKAVKEWADLQAAKAPQILAGQIIERQEAENAALRARLEDVERLIRQAAPNAPTLASAAASELGITSSPPSVGRPRGAGRATKATEEPQE